jgi:diguanylate cyclase (GGDEF)-like protein
MLKKYVSISWYLVAFIVAGMIPVAITAYLSVSQAGKIEAQAVQQNELNAYAEFRTMLSDIEQGMTTVARNLAGWDETIIYLNDPTYYQYWKETRVHDAGILNYTIDAVELYDAKGEALVMDNSISPRLIEEANRGAVLTLIEGVPHGLYFHPVYLRGDSGGDVAPDGYLAVSVNIEKGIASQGMLNRSDYRAINWQLQEGQVVAFSDALRQAELKIYRSPEIDAFARLLRLSFGEYVMFSVVLLVVFSLLLFTSVGRPLQRLARYIKQMHDGATREIPESFQGWTRIAELEQVRNAVNQYRNKFHTARESLMEKNQELERLTYRDTLTGVFNRRAFETHLLQALESARDEGMSHALCYLDLDQFKVVNDTCGHIAGDELLKQVTARLHSRLRESDILARLGGDEFGVLLNGCSTKRAAAIAEDLRQTVKHFRFIWEDKVFDIGVSIGVVAISGDAGTLADLLKMADAACYMAKDLGRNRVHMHQPDDEHLAQRYGEMQWVSKITRALEEDRFELYCQPIVPLHDLAGDRLYCELLIRMHDDEGNLVPPMAFLPAAERYNLISSIDRWVLAAACKLVSQYQAFFSKLQEPPTIAVNLSGQSVGDTEFLQFAVDQLQRTGIDPTYFCFEVTETAAITHLVAAKRFIDVLRGMGCRFALDDFGSGLSSFAYLKNLHVDCLKIDGHFVKNMANDPIDCAMVASINQIGHLLGMQTIAEFVEDEASVARLTEMGVDFGQGYGIARPEPFVAALERRFADAAGPVQWSRRAAPTI